MSLEIQMKLIKKIILKSRTRKNINSISMIKKRILIRIDRKIKNTVTFRRLCGKLFVIKKGIKQKILEKFLILKHFHQKKFYKF